MGDRISPVSVRRRRRRQPINLVLVLVCAGLCLCAGLFEKPVQTPRAAATIRTAAITFEDAVYIPDLSDPFHQHRPVYPYSVIPGGALSRNELARAMNRDPVVARHYSGFATHNTQVVRAQDEKLVHVSYRIDNKVFWSTKKIRLARGENLLSDGVNLARTRCGNRISVIPQGPTSPEEPPIETFEFPIVPERPEAPLMQANLDPGLPQASFAEFPQLSPVVPTLALPPATRVWSPPNLPSVIPMPQPPITPKPGTVPPGTVQPGTVQPTTIPEVPEPGTLILLASGLAAAAWLKFRSKR